MVYTTYSCCFHHKIKTPKYIWFIICINTNTGDLHANLFSIYLPYGVNGASWCLSMPAMVLPGTMEIASLRSLAEMMESDVWTLKLNWMSQVLVSWQVCFQVSVFFAAQTRWCPSLLFARPARESMEGAVANATRWNIHLAASATAPFIIWPRGVRKVQFFCV